MFKVYSTENQNFYLNNFIIPGMQNIDISYNNNINPSLAVLDSKINYFVSRPIVANLDLTYILSDNDQFILYTGSNSFSGKLEYGNNYFTFSSGYLTNYSLNYKFGEYPQVNIKSIVLGELANSAGSFSYEQKLLNDFKISDNCYIDLNLNEANFNRLEAFNINIDIQEKEFTQLVIIFQII